MRRMVSTMAAALLAAAAPPATGDERLVSPAIPGFIVGYTAANASESIREEVPHGQTVEGWSQMITTQRFVGLVARTTPVAFAVNIAARTKGACAGAAVSPIRALRIGGHPAGRMQVDCPNNDGKPESFVFLAIAGKSDMHVKQAAVRGAGAPQKLGWGDRMLDKTVLCVGHEPKPMCG